MMGAQASTLKDNIDYITRKDYFYLNSISKEKEFDCWLCVDRHPGSDISIQDFTNLHLKPILLKISLENKQCVLMGDFNVDLLNIRLKINSVS